MKTGALETVVTASPIVRLVDESVGESRELAVQAKAPQPAESSVVDEQARLMRARAFAEPLLAGQLLDTGEDALHHAEGVVAILRHIGASPAMLAAVYLVYVGEYLAKPEEVIAKAFGPSYATLVAATLKLVQIQRNARDALVDEEMRAEQTERVRKMLLAFSKDLRVVLVRLASRLQTLRYYAAAKKPCPLVLARESMQVFSPLANRLGIWQVKWELEDLSFRFLEPEQYKAIARMLDEKRVEREQVVESARQRVTQELRLHGIEGEVQGRPKHIYSIWKKMRGKQVDFDHVFDIRALRVIVSSVRDCYATLSLVHESYRPLPEEFDDYIARPKANGYQSLHTVVYDEKGRAIEIQIRTGTMHEHAEHGVAAHWAYKEAGTKGYGGVSAAGEFEEKVAQARKAVLRQLLAWERDFSGQGEDAGLDDRIYVFTPQASVVELPRDATPVDFAYTVHTDLGHRCRGARIDGAMVPLNTPLSSGQTVEVITTKEGGPSMDWLNPELGYLKSSRAKAKVRAWFNALVQQQTIAKGRELVEKLLQREGRTAVKLEDLARQLGFKSADALFDVVGKDEYSLRNIEQLLRPSEPAPTADDVIALKKARSDAVSPKGGVLVVGVESLLTTLARCCRPAPPDAIGGYVTKGKGVAIHRKDCSSFRQIAGRNPERMIPVAWGTASSDKTAVYPVDVAVEAHDRQGLLRDISEVFAKEKMNVIGVNSQTVKDRAWMTFTIEVIDSARLSQVLQLVSRVAGVRSARRR